MHRRDRSETVAGAGEIVVREEEVKLPRASSVIGNVKVVSRTRSSYGITCMTEE
jgi:hypothetical protein